MFNRFRLSLFWMLMQISYSAYGLEPGQEPRKFNPVPNECLRPRDRANSCSFYRECLEKSLACESTKYAYALTYAEKYCGKFTAVRPEMSDQGRKWNDGTRNCLQEIVPLWDGTKNSYNQWRPHWTTRTHIELSCETVRKQEFDGHPECYLGGPSKLSKSTHPSICNLPIGDQLNILTRLDPGDVMSKEAIVQMVVVADACIASLSNRSFNSPVESGFSRTFSVTENQKLRDLWSWKKQSWTNISIGIPAPPPPTSIASDIGPVKPPVTPPLPTAVITNVSLVQKVNGDLAIVAFRSTNINQQDLVSYLFTSGDWQSGGSFGLNSATNASAVQNRDNANLEVVAQKRDLSTPRVYTFNGLTTFWQDADGWHQGDSFGSGMLDNPSMIQNTFSGNLEVIASTRQIGVLKTFWHDSNGWHEGASFGSYLDNPSMIQSASGNFEVIARNRRSTGSNDAFVTFWFDSNGWHQGASFGTNAYHPSIVQNRNNGNLEVVAQRGDSLVTFWHDASGWHEGASFGSGITGGPSMIQNSLNGNLEVAAPRGSTIATYWHDSNGWHAGAVLSGN